MGDLSANLIQMILASTGLGVVLATFNQLLQAIKWTGVLYLIYLGISKVVTKSTFSHTDTYLRHKKLFWTGFLTSASNPKAILFFATLFPLFFDVSLSLTPQLVTMGSTFLLLDGLALLLYAYLGTRISYLIRSKERMHLQSKISGFFLVIAALLLALMTF